MADPDLTGLLHRLSRGEKEAEAELFPHVYRELQKIARGCLRGERQEHTLQATALVNEAYLKLVADAHIDFKNRAHFFGLAAQGMRRILVDYARQRIAGKRAGFRVDLDDQLIVSPEQCALVGDLHDALERLEEFAPRAAKVVELRYFGGMTEEEIADLLNVSEKTVKRDWQMARGWLRGELSK
jgi:RNA polymerase sigma-70 factor (ECF subfamily)